MKWLFISLITMFCIAESMAWNTEPRCPIVSIPNGKVRSRGRGKIIRFNCYDGYTLVGNKYSTCVRGAWDTPTPVCVNSQCPKLSTPENALVATKYDGAILMYFCKPGYQLFGTAEIFCNGRQWNGTAPHCRDTKGATPQKCDFEKTDLCWWEQDPKHDFDWTRHNFETPSSHIGTGPTHDHTYGPGKDGYYLYIEASGRLENDTARIKSPLYNSSLTENGCFSFWYHMYGAMTGSLRIYFKPETNLNNPRMMWEKHGNQGNQWLHGLFDLPKTNVSFQIIIEGVRGASYVSDLAVDDVEILQGEECAIAKKNTAATTPESITDNSDQIEIVNALQSCRGRCDDNPTMNIGMTSPDACHCTIDCAENSTCCPDFAEYCVLAIMDFNTTPAFTTITVEPLPTELKEKIEPNNTQPLERTTIQRFTTKSILNLSSTPKQRFKKTSTTEVAETPFLQMSTESKVLVEKVSQLHPAAFLGLTDIISIVVIFIATVILAGFVTFVVMRRKKSYKRNSGNGKSSALSEDSDVRFLTSDEALDFNLARPNDYNELQGC